MIYDVNGNPEILTLDKCETIATWLNFSDYEVVNIYEDSFRMMRKNEQILSELNVELLASPRTITFQNVYDNVTFCCHVLKRYKGNGGKN